MYYNIYREFKSTHFIFYLIISISGNCSRIYTKRKKHLSFFLTNKIEIVVNENLKMFKNI